MENVQHIAFIGIEIENAERLADKLGKPNASRAVGLANGSNPVGVVLPCHRVIGADGSLTGYGGGLPRKQWLLAHEGVKLRKGNQLALDLI